MIASLKVVYTNTSDDLGTMKNAISYKIVVRNTSAVPHFRIAVKEKTE